MNKSIYLLIIALIIIMPAYTQNSGIVNKNIIMLKLKVENRHLVKNNLIKDSNFEDLCSKITNWKLNRSFPKHLPPQNEINEFGDELVDLSLWFTLNFDNSEFNNKLIPLLKSTNLFQFIEYRSINKLFYTPSDPKIGNQYYLDNIKAYDAWDIEKGDTNIVVAITDTGIDKLQEDLIEGIKYNYNDTVDGIDNDNDGFIDNFCGWDVANNDNNSQWSAHGHGTFVSGFVSAVPNNNIGIAGVGYRTKVLPVRIDNTDGSLSADYEGIVYAADHGAAIINCSWGGPGGENFGRDVVNYATNNKGALIVAACGNSNNANWLYPASYENVLSCAATDTFDVRWSQSSYGTTVDLSAPGTYVYSTWVNNAYFSSHGTSFSAPIIAAAAALVKAHFPQLTNLQIAEQLRVTADIIDTISENTITAGLMGAGRLNIYNALTDTLKPSIRFKNQSLTISNDTLFISGDFINYLTQSSADLNVKLYSPSPYLIPIMDSINLGIIPTLTSISNITTPLKYKILPNIPIGEFADIQLIFSDTSYSGFEWTRIYLNKQTSQLDTNNITTSVNSVSTIGYTDEAKMVGSGFTFNNGRNLLSWGGLVIASSNSKISDNIYGGNGIDSNFAAISSTQEITGTTNEQRFFSVFNDDNAGFSKNNIEVSQYSYAFNNSDLNNIIFLEYNIVNKNFSPLNNIYVAFYADWDIGLSYENKASYNSNENIAYTWATAGGTYTGVQLMSKTMGNCYNFDNDGSNSSINIYDGFLKFEKWNAIQTSRNDAGTTNNGADVSTMLSAGAYSIASLDTLKVTFALLAGNHENEILASANAANYWFFNTASIDNSKKKLGVKLLQNTPNPTSDNTTISFHINSPNYIKLELYNIEGKLLKSIYNGIITEGNHSYIVNTSSLSAGIYIYKLTTKEGSISKKMIKE